VTIFVSGCQPAPADLTLTGRTMGTSWSVRAIGCPLPNCENQLTSDIETQLANLNAVFSHYDPASELSRFNDHGGTDWYKVSPSFAEVAELGQLISRQSDGAFDLTVAPAVDTWGFGATERSNAQPDVDVVTAAGALIDYKQLQVRAQPPSLRKQNAALRIDASAIAKGYAVDQLSYLLEENGISNYLVDIGGEVRTGGVRADGKSWRIGIERPELASANAPAIEYIVIPGNRAVATSGDYRNYYRVDDTLYSHTINPRTATPIDNGIAAVTVIAPSAAQADAWATALMVLGDDAGFVVAEREQLAAMFTRRDAVSNRTRSRYTTEFAAFLLSTD